MDIHGRATKTPTVALNADRLYADGVFRSLVWTDLDVLNQRFDGRAGNRPHLVMDQFLVEMGPGDTTVDVAGGHEAILFGGIRATEVSRDLRRTGRTWAVHHSLELRGEIQGDQAPRDGSPRKKPSARLDG